LTRTDAHGGGGGRAPRIVAPRRRSAVVAQRQQWRCPRDDGASVCGRRGGTACASTSAANAANQQGVVDTVLVLRGAGAGGGACGSESKRWARSPGRARARRLRIRFWPGLALSRPGSAGAACGAGPGPHRRAHLPLPASESARYSSYLKIQARRLSHRQSKPVVRVTGSSVILIRAHTARPHCDPSPSGSRVPSPRRQSCSAVRGRRPSMQPERASGVGVRPPPPPPLPLPVRGA
jgi:hypothetical protein